MAVGNLTLWLASKKIKRENQLGVISSKMLYACWKWLTVFRDRDFINSPTRIFLYPWVWHFQLVLSLWSKYNHSVNTYVMIRVTVDLFCVSTKKSRVKDLSPGVIIKFGAFTAWDGILRIGSMSLCGKIQKDDCISSFPNLSLLPFYFFLLLSPQFKARKQPSPDTRNVQLLNFRIRSLKNGQK